MFKQKPTHNQQSSHFQPLACDSPQIKPSQSIQQPEDINIEDQKEIQQIGDIKNRRKKLRAKKTNLIKIKPVQSQYDSTEPQIQYLPQPEKSYPQPEQSILPSNTQSKWEKPQPKRSKDQKSQQTLQSPVLYRISDESDSEQRQQTIPQSSRRPLKLIKKQILQPISVQKRSDSDQPDSPVKLINKQRKISPKLQTNPQKMRRFIKMKRQVELAQKRQPTQIYDYDNDPSSDDEEQQQGLDQQNNSQQNQSSPQDNDEIQYQNQQQIKQKHTQQQKKPEITVFKSNSFYTLINAQIPKGNFINCLIRRKRTDDYFQKIVTYQLYLLQDKKYLMTCTKDRLFKTTSHFEFYREKTNTLKYHKDNLYAYMDSNFTGTEFVLKTIQKNDTNSQRSTAIDKSEILKMEESTSVISDQVHKAPSFYPNQNKSGKPQESIKTLDDKQVLFMSFKANFFGFGGQREVKILKKKNKKLKNTGNFSNLRSAQQNGEIDKYTEINNKKAIEGKNGLQLDFKGIAKMQSTKNFILQTNDGKQVLIYGKVKQDIYAVAIGSPLSIVEGLAFGIANLDRKFFVN